MNAFLGEGGAVLLVRALLDLRVASLSAQPDGILWGVVRVIEEATGFEVGGLTALGAGGTLLLVVVALAVIRQVAALVVSFAVLAGLLAWWAGWLS